MAPVSLHRNILNSTAYRQALGVYTTSRSIGVMALCPGEKRSEQKYDHSPGIEVENARSYVFVLPHISWGSA